MTLSLSPSELAYQEAHASESLQANVIVGIVVCLTAAYISVILRFASRRLGKSPYGKDEVAVMIALAATTALSVLSIILTTYGLGKHQITQKPADREPFQKMTIAARNLTFVSMTATKVSILFLYHRIFPSRAFAKYLKGVGAFVTTFSIAGVLTNVLACLPMKALWEPDIEAKCINEHACLTAMSTIDILTDVVILCLPLSMVWRLQMSTKNKWQVTGMFLVGSLVCVGGVVRTVYSIKVSRTDATWDNAMPGMWATIQSNIAIVSACLPTLRPVVRFFLGKRPAASTTTITHSQSGNRFSRSDYAQRMEFVKMDSEMEMERMSPGESSKTGSEDMIAPAHDGKASMTGFVEEYGK